MENLYSTIFIVDISMNPDEVETVSSRIQQLIEDHGGIIKSINKWGKRRLAYEINKKSHGFYVEIEFSANSHLNIPKILEGEYRLNDRVLRYFTYIVTKDELIQRAKRAGKAAEEEAPKEVEETPEAEEKAEAAEATVKTVAVETPSEEKAEAEPEVEETKEDKEEE
ncbi:MAG: hypothetical protein Kow0037_14150 [Calditrichia bacterium]